MLFVSAHKITVFFFYKKQFIERDKKRSVAAGIQRFHRTDEQELFFLQKLS